MKHKVLALLFIPLLCLGSPERERVEYWMRRTDSVCSMCKKHDLGTTSDWTVELSFKDPDGEKEVPIECVYMECTNCHHVDLFRLAERIKDE